jgi:hypothetical protein
MTDHDVLIKISVQMDELSKQFTNHLAHHRIYTLLAFSTSLSLIVALILVIVKLS